MTSDRPNVLLLTIDALRADRLSLHGYGRPTTPTLERLAEAAIVCDENITTTAFTEPALPSMLTSSLPLSFGGYDAGAYGRPMNVFEVFNGAGYRTTLISTFPWVSRFYGYRKGVDDEHMLFVINALVGVSVQSMVSSLSQYHDDPQSSEADFDKIVAVVGKLLDDLDAYCDARLEQADFDRGDMAWERLLRDGYDYPRIKRIVATHRNVFRADAAAYIRHHLSKVPRAHEWIAADWRFARRPTALFQYGLERLMSRVLMPLAPARARLFEYRCKRYVDAHALANRIIRVIDEHDPGRPFFVWTHFVDAHVPYCPGATPDWRRRVPDYLSALGYRADIDPAIAAGPKPTTEEGWAAWRALYDAAARYVDEQIGRVITALEKRGLAEDTLVVIASDHGEELGDHGDISHHFRLYEHNIRVPLLFHRSGIAAKRIDALTTHLDLAPTMAGLAGVAPAPGWQGLPVTSPAVADREYVLAEAFHGGSCLFDRRPPYVAVRTRQYKYLWKEYRDPSDRFSLEGPELYDHRADPGERNNLYRADHPALPALNRAVAVRLAEIQEISPERIVAAFGADGKDAVRLVRGRDVPLRA